MADTTPNRPPRNPAHLLGLGTAPALCRLLRACGTDEACITGGASDYDKFLALAAAMPLCEGHLLRDEVNAGLTAATGITAPLCPHTARLHWDAWVESYLYGSAGAKAVLPAVCPDCAPAVPTVLRALDLLHLPHPATVKAPDLTAWTEILESHLPLETDGIALLTLPADYRFLRPNPYHAGLAVGKVYRGEELTPAEGDLLLTQALRVWGLASVGRGVTLLLRDGSPDAVTALLAYLQASKALPSAVWIPTDPMNAEAVSGLYASVRTGYAVDALDPAGTERAYAAVAPLGRAVVLAG